MKYFIFIILLFICLSGCGPCYVDFTYRGHHYISFNFAPPSGNNAGIVHDPDCPCWEKKEEKQ